MTRLKSILRSHRLRSEILVELTAEKKKKKKKKIKVLLFSYEWLVVCFSASGAGTGVTKGAGLSKMSDVLKVRSFF